MSGDVQVESDATDNALDWLVNWAMGVDGDARDHYFHICGGETATCGCKYEGEDSR